MLLQTEYSANLKLSSHVLEVPLCWNKPESGPQIELFYREVCDRNRQDEDLPLLVFLQGGPGGKSPRPTEDGPIWLHEAIKKYRVILPDQRGTGRSQRVTGRLMAGFDSAGEAADYLARLNAHAITHDLEHIRHSDYQGRTWTSLGQSYGGFLTLTYLSHAPQALDGCLITGGLPGLEADADEVYRHTYERVREKWEAHTRHFLEDQTLFNRVADIIAINQVVLPNGDPLSVQRLQYLGFLLGMSDGSQRLHWLLEEAFADRQQTVLNHHFLLDVMNLTGMDENPLFSAIHENIYANPHKPCDFAAERQRPPPFAPTARPLYPTGEMIYPWMFAQIGTLRAYKEAVEELARRLQPRPYYDPAQLAKNTVPVAAAIYFNDMYVDSRLSLETARRINNLQYWLTNEYEHNGLRQDGRVFNKLDAMLAQMR